MAKGDKPPVFQETEAVWRVEEGQTSEPIEIDTYTAGGVENLTYSNPYKLEIERVWFDDKIVYAIAGDEVEIEFDSKKVAKGNKVAQEYQIVYSVELDEEGKPPKNKEPEAVEGQLNIYDSVPGMEIYSPLWQFNYVVVPRNYVPNTLRSESACLESGYLIHKSTVVEN
ncbi:MAG: hypothetical protein M3R06_07605 [Chloroflexota bacterium]|nr:hypothetical protein [Chloroflexota bacterium]